MPGDIAKKRTKDNKIKKDDTKEMANTNRKTATVATTAKNNDNIHVNTSSRNGSLSLQLITLSVFCAFIGVVLFGFPQLDNHNVYGVGDNIKQLLRKIDVYFSSEVISDSGGYDQKKSSKQNANILRKQRISDMDSIITENTNEKRDSYNILDENGECWLNWIHRIFEHYLNFKTDMADSSQETEVVTQQTVTPNRVVDNYVKSDGKKNEDYRKFSSGRRKEKINSINKESDENEFSDEEQDDKDVINIEQNDEVKSNSLKMIFHGNNWRSKFAKFRPYHRVNSKFSKSKYSLDENHEAGKDYINDESNNKIRRRLKSGDRSKNILIGAKLKEEGDDDDDDVGEEVNYIDISRIIIGNNEIENIDDDYDSENDNNNDDKSENINGDTDGFKNSDDGENNDASDGELKHINDNEDEKSGNAANDDELTESNDDELVNVDNSDDQLEYFVNYNNPYDSSDSGDRADTDDLNENSSEEEDVNVHQRERDSSEEIVDSAESILDDTSKNTVENDVTENQNPSDDTSYVNGDAARNFVEHVQQDDDVLDRNVLDIDVEESRNEESEQDSVEEEEGVSYNEDIQDDVFMDESATSSDNDVSEEISTQYNQTAKQRDFNPVNRSFQGNYTFDSNLELSEESDSEAEETNNNRTFESQWTASGAKILAKEVEQSDISESDNDEIAETDESENSSSESNVNDRNPQLYSRAKITNKNDWMIRDELDEAESDLDAGKVTEALEKFEKLLEKNERSCRAKYGVAVSLDKQSEMQKSNSLLSRAIQSYMNALNCDDITDDLFKLIADRTINRIRFRGMYEKCIFIHNQLIDRFPDEVSFQNALAITYLMLNKLNLAKEVLEKVLSRWPKNGVAMVHYGFVLKMQSEYTKAVHYFADGLKSNETETQDARFYFHFGDALYRLGRKSEAMQVYEDGAAKGLFRSKYQRSFYNVDHLTARPFWTLKQTTYEKFFGLLEQNWKKIRDEAVNVLNQRKSLFLEETESLREVGDWSQFEIYHSGAMKPDCNKVPTTCRLVASFSPAASCRQGQIKFSLMLPNTHVWPHCGPSNARLRAHLGLIIPSGVLLRVADEQRKWEEGKVLVFDDSFEHEVWHNGTSMRLVLIVDVWHPELTNYEKKTLPTI